MPCCTTLRRITVDQSAVQLFGWVIGGLALLIGSYAFQNDLDWNSMIEGNAELKLGVDKGFPRFKLNLTVQQQRVLIRNPKLEIVYLSGLSLFLVISLGVYTYVWIKDSDLKSNCISPVTTAFHGMGSILLACLGISVLNGTIGISGHNKDVCIGRYSKDLLSAHSNVNHTLLKFLQDASCVCAEKKTSAMFNSVVYNLDLLKDLGICQNSFLKHISGIALFLYTVIAILLACTQLKDMMVIKSATSLHPAHSGHSSRSFGRRPSNSIRPKYCNCNSKMNVALRMNPQPDTSNNNNCVINKEARQTFVINVDDNRGTNSSLYAKYLREDERYSSKEEVVVLHKFGGPHNGNKEKKVKDITFKDSKDENKNHVFQKDNLKQVPEKKTSISTNGSLDPDDPIW